MADTFKTGDEVAWDTSQGETHGTVQRKLTAKTRIKGHVANASAEHPQYLVKSAKTGAEAAHRAEALRRRTKKR